MVQDNKKTIEGLPEESKKASNAGSRVHDFSDAKGLLRSMLKYPFVVDWQIPDGKDSTDETQSSLNFLF